jgi:hypothetical protein
MLSVDHLIMCSQKKINAVGSSYFTKLLGLSNSETNFSSNFESDESQSREL